jgi:3-oxoacyl-[acyl-carrier-protein] synthase II
MKEIVITGLGVSTSIGTGIDAFWSGLLEGRNGAQAITVFDAGEHFK